MSIKWKLLLMVSLPITAMIIILAMGLASFKIIDTDMTHANILHMDRATMIDADRDAYQAQTAIMKAIDATSMEEFSKAQDSVKENTQQTWDRIIGPSENFTPEMSTPLGGFKTGFEKWKQDNTTILSLTAQTLEANIERNQAEQKALASFDSMRDVIDKLGEIAGNRLKDQSLGADERMQMESALSKILNADRDAYQAYVAQILIIRAMDIKAVNDLAESFKENVGQTKDRASQGADLLGSEAAALKNEFLTLFEAWNENSQKTVDLTKANVDKNVKRVELFIDSNKNFSLMRDSIDKLGEMEIKRVEADLEDMDSVISTTIWTYVLVTLAFLIAAVVTTLIVSSRISKAMKDSAEVAEALSRGDFTVELDVRRNDEIGQLANAMTAMITKLRSIVYDVQAAASNVASGSEELAGSSEALSQGATEQASAVEEVSSSMEQMTVSISQNTDNSAKTETIARKTASDGREGGEAVQQTVQAMKQIAEKISIIEEIARQTNLLALNAAIEAARAGEQGKGFAVVAAEVRKLAERSGSAAAEIGELSESSVTVATKAGEMLGTIVPNIEQTSELIQDISAASSEQNIGATEINSALQQLDNVVQSNAGSSEEIASTAEQLSSQAMLLEQTMTFFRLGATDAPRPTSQQSVVKPAPQMLAQAPSQGVALEMDGDDGDFERF